MRIEKSFANGEPLMLSALVEKLSKALRDGDGPVFFEPEDGDPIMIEGGIVGNGPGGRQVRLTSTDLSTLPESI